MEGEGISPAEAVALRPGESRKGATVGSRDFAHYFIDAHQPSASLVLRHIVLVRRCRQQGVLGVS
jgi:hypothetical protein